MKKNALIFAKSIFSAKDIREIKDLNTGYIKRLKVVVFVPEKYSDKLTYEMASAGAGQIGKYSLCSFRANGTGTFKGGKGTKPVIGRKGKFEKTNEVRLEMICDRKDLDRIIEKMLKIHPYEEPAYDIYEVYVRDKKTKPGICEVNLNKSIRLKQVLNKINTKIQTNIIAEMPVTGRFNRAVINFTGDDSIPGFIDTKNKKALYITLNKNENIYISFK
jgi:hypothetical protein